jgi:raffinose/stachyose/melibiose transport system permease protein
LKQNFYSYNLLLPAAIIFGVFNLAAIGIGLVGSFHYWTLYDFRWLGLRNYARILQDPFLNIAFKNTFIFAVVTTIGKVGIGYILALMFHRRFWGTNFLRSVFFLPSIITTIAIGAMFNIFLHPSIGFINRGLRAVGLDMLALDWLTDQGLAIFSVSGIEIWKWSGFLAMILLAGLQSIPQDYYDAAAIDGVNAWQKNIYITIPLILPTLNNAIILQIIYGMRVMDLILTTTNGGPGVATEVLNLVVFKSFNQGHYGQAAAALNLLTLIIVVLTVFGNRLLRRREVEA